MAGSSEAASSSDEVPTESSASTRRSGGETPRRRLEAAEARDVILAAAESLLVVSGPEALRLTEIAAKAGVSHPNVLYHFGSVAELQRQLAQRVAVRLANEIARVFAGEEGLAMPVDEAVAACFSVFDEGGYARLLAWLALSANQPTWEAVGSNLGALRAAIVAHPSLTGDANADRRRRVVPVIELVIVSAIGYGLMGAVVEGFFESDPLRPNVSRLLSELLVAVNDERRP